MSFNLFFPFLILWVEQVAQRVGDSNADNPASSPVLYDPNAAPGNRFSSTGISSNINRMYHSTATLTPNGDILVGKYFDDFICD
jgi:hypothetical protein